MNDFLDGMVRKETHLSPTGEGPPSIPGIDTRGPMSRADTEEWVAKRIEEAKRVAEQASLIRDKISQLPPTRDAARERKLRAKMCEVFGIPVRADMDPTAFRAAVVYGWGMTVQETAMALGCKPSEIYAMMDDNFRAVANHWRAQRMEEYFAIILRTVDSLLETVDSPDLLIKLLKEVKSLAMTREEQRRWEKELELREREVAAKERDSTAYAYQVGLGPLPAGATEAIDIEIVDAEWEDAPDDDGDSKPQ